MRREEKVVKSWLPALSGWGWGQAECKGLEEGGNAGGLGALRWEVEVSQ